MRERGDVDWHDITLIFCGGRVHLEHVHSIMILQLREEWSRYAVGHITERLCSKLAEGRIAGCLFSTERGNLLRNGKDKHESLGGGHGITADTARATSMGAATCAWRHGGHEEGVWVVMLHGTTSPFCPHAFLQGELQGVTAYLSCLFSTEVATC